MGKVDKKNKEPKGKKKRGWVRRVPLDFLKNRNIAFIVVFFFFGSSLQLGRGQKAAVQIDQPDPHAADSLQETYRG